MMKELLVKLDKLVRENPDACYFNDPIDTELISHLEEKHGIKLPGSFKEFLGHFNGGFISMLEGRDEIGIDDLAWNSNYILAVQLIDELFGSINYKTEGTDVKYIPCIHTSGGEYLGFRFPLDENGESMVYDLWHEAPASEWAESVVYDNFTDLLKDYIENKGMIETM